MSTTIEHKRGTTFSHLATVPESVPDGYFVGWEPTSQIRDVNDVLVCELEVAWVDAATTRNLTLTSGSTPTGAWPLGLLYMDVKFTASSGVARSSDTVTIKCTRGITHA